MDLSDSFPLSTCSSVTVCDNLRSSFVPKGTVHAKMTRDPFITHHLVGSGSGDIF